jgi:LPS-assembly protein
VNGRRDIFQTTLDLSGVAFLTEPRSISPLISRLRFRSSAHTDIEWDFDLDTGAKKFTSSNVFLDVHAKSGLFGALSYARLDAPGRFYTESVSPTATSGVTTAISDFNQLRLLMGWGSPVKPGLSLGANAGLDLKSLYGATGTETSPTGAVTTTTVYPALLQYATIQGNYNWNCCGIQVEYRKFELGSVRNEGTYRFNFTLANIGSAGNLRRAERLF